MTERGFTSDIKTCLYKRVWRNVVLHLTLKRVYMNGY